MFPGFLIEILITLIIVGLLFWVLQQIPLPDPIGRIVRVVLIVFVAIWLIYILAGLLPAGGFYGPRLR